MVHTKRISSSLPKEYFRMSPVISRTWKVQTNDVNQRARDRVLSGSGGPQHRKIAEQKLCGPSAIRDPAEKPGHSKLKGENPDYFILSPRGANHEKEIITLTRAAIKISTPEVQGRR